MLADTCAVSGGNLSGGDLYQVIPYSGTLPCRNSDPCKRHKQTVSADYLKKLGLVDVHGVDLIVVNNRTKSWTGEGNLCLGIFFLEIPGMHTCGKSIFSKIVQPQKGAESYSPHTTHKGSFLGIDTVRVNPFMTCQMEGLIFVCMIGFLENRDIVCSAFMKVGVLIRIHRINLQTDDPEIFPGDLTGLSNIFYGGFFPALPCQNQDFLKAGLGNSCHFLVNLFIGKLGSFDPVMAVKPAVYTVVFTVICYVDRREHINGITEVLPGLLLGTLSNLLQQRQRCRRKEGLKVFRCLVIMGKSSSYICLCIQTVVIISRSLPDFVHHIALNHLHIRQIFPVICPLSFFYRFFFSFFYVFFLFVIFFSSY